ncbi:aminotransferase class III-fold pyridoxal phosphate-dependent enzyme [Streptomyces sp. NPDC023998]|uniref:aspartate aminotransferase family protein n=1 Tax=Streptomyces sp. NPDC023998 TaxID=3154597 RepID=UPI0034004287
MASQTSELELAEPMMLQWLSMLGVDVEYVRGEGNTLHYLDDKGKQISVLDYAGGYGALILGHNHPEIVAAAKDFLDAGTPVLAQASRQSAASSVASTLNTILHREFGVDEPYFAVFSNSGAESVEVALKHAEFDRILRIQALGQEIAAHIDAARTTVQSGGAKVTEAAYDLLGIGTADRSGGISGFERLVAGIQRENAKRTSRPPLFLTLEGSFHGKLVGSVQLTHNASFRTPFAAMAPQARFIPFDQPEALGKVFEEERGTVFDVVVEGGEVTVVERDFPVFGAFVFEVIQGEGGIKVVTEELAAEIQRACAAADCPIVIDEIQSGMGRTGAFFASSLIGLRADYYTLAKSLGGGIAKAAVTLVSGSRYRHEFELVHSSTFAKDTFSSTLALKVLQLLEAEGGGAYRLAREWGDRLTALFHALRNEFPDVVKDVRGKGLMLGLEFHDQSASSVAGIRDAALTDTFGYIVSGYLFRAHRIRTFPTASAVNTLRFEPSVLLTDPEVDRLDVALRELCVILRDQSEQLFFGS